MPDRNPVPIQFIHDNSILSAKLLFNLLHFKNVVLVKLDEPHDKFHSIIVMHKEDERWMSDDFNQIYPETMNYLDMIIRTQLSSLCD